MSGLLGAALLTMMTPGIAVPASPAIPPAAIDDALEIGGEHVAARSIRSRLSVPVTINDQGPFRFVVDSGADRSVIGAQLAHRLALPPSRAVTMHDMTGVTRVGTVSIDRLRVGASEVESIQAPTLLESHLGAQGLLGIDALAEQRLMMDFERRVIAVEDARRPTPPAGSDEIVVTARRRNGQLILTEVRVGRLKVHAVIDTGSEITIGNSALRAAIQRRRRPPPLSPVELIGVSGQVYVAELTTLPEIGVGSLTLSDLPVAFGDPPPFALFGLADRPAMMLGTDVLELFRRVSLDFRKRKVRFQLRRDQAMPRGLSIAGPMAR